MDNIVNSIDDIIEICNQLKATTKTKDKENILAEHKDNKHFLDFLHFLFDPMILTGIKMSKLNQEVDYDLHDTDFESLYDLYDYFKTHNTGTNTDIANCQYYLDGLSDIQQDFVADLIVKDIKLGINLKTLKKVFGNDFIQTWDVQQAYSIQNHKLEDNIWFAISRKANGIRCTFYNGKLISRQGKEFTDLHHIKRDIYNLGLNKYFIDGELIRKNTDNISDEDNFRKTCSIVSDHDHSKKTEIQFVIFDIFPANSYVNGQSKEKYSERLQLLNYLDSYLKTELGNDYPNLCVIERLYNGYDQTKIQYYLDQMDEEGKEGCMVNKDVIYESKRHTGILKVKTFFTMDLKIVGYKEHKDKNRLGSFTVAYKGNTIDIPGYTYEDSVRFWNNRDNYIGKIIEVKYKKESCNQDGQKSLQHAVFVRVRDDKTTESLE